MPHPEIRTRKKAEDECFTRSSAFVSNHSASAIT